MTMSLSDVFKVKEVSVQLVVHLVRLYFSKVPFRIGKRLLWDYVVTRHLLWRKIKTKARTRFGSLMDVDIQDSIQRFIFFFGVFEPAITEYVAKTLQPGDIFIDIGANVGYYSLLASKLVGPRGSVFAFEASPSIFEMLQNNLRANRATNVKSFNVAITATSCDVNVYRHDSSNLGGTTISRAIALRRATFREASVKGLPLRSIIAPEIIQRARLIKIDVEGSEWGVLAGFREFLPILSENNAEILLEVDRDALADQGVSVRELFDMFEVAGFQWSLVRNEYNESFYFSTRDLVPVSAVDDAAFPPLSDWIFYHRDLQLPRHAPVFGSANARGSGSL